jgi:hypothetical protein
VCNKVPALRAALSTINFFPAFEGHVQDVTVRRRASTHIVVDRQRYHDCSLAGVIAGEMSVACNVISGIS